MDHPGSRERALKPDLGLGPQRFGATRSSPALSSDHRRMWGRRPQPLPRPSPSGLASGPSSCLLAVCFASWHGKGRQFAVWAAAPDCKSLEPLSKSLFSLPTKGLGLRALGKILCKPCVRTTRKRSKGAEGSWDKNQASRWQKGFFEADGRLRAISSAQGFRIS